MRRRPSRSAIAPVFPLCFVAPVLSSSVPLAHCIRVATLRPVNPMFALGRVERRIGAPQNNKLKEKIAESLKVAAAATACQGKLTEVSSSGLQFSTPFPVRTHCCQGFSR